MVPVALVAVFAVFWRVQHEPTESEALPSPPVAAAARKMPVRDQARESRRLPKRQVPGAKDAAPEGEVLSPAEFEELSDDELAELTAEEFKAHALGDRLEERGEEVRRQELGRRRFASGVAESGVSAKQMDVAVVSLFETVDLEPVLDHEGMLEGLAVEDLDHDSPLLDAGFQRGDVITRIDDQPLRDPAEVPALLVALGRDVDFCGQRADEEICATVHLD
jgi:hypothetical protein